MIDSPLLGSRSGFIGGRWDSGHSSARFEVVNPANGAILAELPLMSRDDAARSVQAAFEVLGLPISLERRRELLLALVDQIRKEREEIGRIITLENGKPLAEACAEADYAAGFYQYAADHLDRLTPRRLEENPRGHEWTVYARPAGVAGLITPWNFPFAMIAKKLAASLAAGAPAVIKPAEKTPLAMIALFTLLERIGMPSGLANLVFGDASAIGSVLCTDPRVRVVSFTGSTRVGRILLEQSAPHFKRLALELGGNAPFVVFADADLGLAAEHLVQNKLRAGGQTCVCANRLLVERSVADRFEQELVSRLEPLRVGDGMEPGVAVGPMIDRAGYEKVGQHLEDAVAGGARLTYQGRVPVGDDSDEAAETMSRDWGWYFPPTVLRHALPTMLCAREETFGPLFPIFEFESEAEALEMSNDTEYGLAAYLFTGDPRRAERMIERLHYGHVGWNSGTGPTPEAPFGGMGHSGFGREGGVEGLMDFVEFQTVARSPS